MFGHQDDKKNAAAEHEETVIAPDQPAEETTDTATDQAAPADAAADAPADTSAADTPGTDAAAADDKPADDVADDGAWQHPGVPLEDDKATEAEEPEDDDKAKGPAPIEDIVGTNAGPDFKPFPAPSTDYHGSNQSDNTPHELIEVKQKALDELAPLIDQLDQSPEDKFRTVMMMIQASDDQSLIESAYAAAHEIKDDKVRAQALLDIVNEINYFTQHPEN